MLQTKTFAIGSWEIKYFPKHESVSCALAAEAEQFLNQEWLPAIRKYPSDSPLSTWAGLDDFNIPSPIIRVEMSPLPGELRNRIFSIGKKPALLGALGMIARQFPEHREIIREGLSGYPFDGFIQIGDFVQDDRLVAEKILMLPYHTEIPKEHAGKYYWVRVDPHKSYPKKLLRKLDALSLVPVRSDGCNAELIALHMGERLSTILFNGFSWKEIDTDPMLEELFDGILPWEKSFVVKPVQGTWGDNVEIYSYDEREEERSAAKDRIKNLVRTLGPERLMIQPYIPDRTVKREGETYHEIWRLYFVYLNGEYVFTGGMTQGSRFRKVCGIDGTYFIPLAVSATEC